MSLLFLPPEILCNVTSQLDLDDLVQLILIGDRTWARYLYAPGSVTWLYGQMRSINSEQMSHLFQAFPQLRVLSCSATLLSVDFLSTLPNTLTRLEIWHRLPGGLAEFDVVASLPFLRHLALGDFDLYSFHSDFIASWPPTLEHLEVSTFESNCPLPASLTALRTLRLLILPVISPVVCNLRFCSLRFDYLEVYNKKVSEWLPTLPRSIEYLELAGLLVVPIWFDSM
jgi:hypothetical protein